MSYSQSWEDVSALKDALRVTPDDTVLSITSGGDNALALLLGGAARVVSVDVNPAQNHLLELKLAAARSLGYEEFIAFLGVENSKERMALAKRVLPLLSQGAREWFTSHLALIERGVIHAGRFERFLDVFRRFGLPLAHSRKEVEAFLASPTLEEQRDFFHRVWDSPRWRLLFSVFASRPVLARFARGPGLFAHAREGSVAKEFLARFARVAESLPLRDNYFIHYCLTGRYGSVLPPYVREENFETLKRLPPDVLALVSEDLVSFLAREPVGSFSKWNLSDVFEGFSEEENARVWVEIVRTSRPGAVVAYWNNLVPRSFPAELADKIADDVPGAADLHARDRVFFYGSFHRNVIAAV
ncbi:MAG: DUF3419 family protein [Patescibacteria group bacterium]